MHPAPKHRGNILTPARSPLWIGLKVQMNGLKALFIRDLMMRYGREQLGFVWVIMEPMLLTGGVMLLWSLLRGGIDHGLTIVELVLTGYMMLTLWRHLTGSTALLFRRNSSLLYHRRISLLDLVLARFFVELAATTSALIFVGGTLLLIGVIGPIGNWPYAVFGWISMALLGLGAGTIVLTLTEANENAEKFIQPIQYLLIPISGTFFMVDWLPERLHSIVLLNPLVHCYEMFRAGFFGQHVVAHFSAGYLVMWSFMLNFSGVLLVSRARKNLQIT